MRESSRVVVLQDKPLVKIHVGDCHVAQAPTVVYTLLGSCVAVCLFDPLMRLGGMNHILLPGCGEPGLQNGAGRYGVNAMELVINRLLACGARRERLVAKAFGGGHVLAAIAVENSVAERNIEFVVDFLRREKIRLLAHDFGGEKTRHVYFHTDSGEVFLRRTHTRIDFVAREEATTIRRIERELHRPGEVSLFQ